MCRLARIECWNWQQTTLCLFAWKACLETGYLVMYPLCLIDLMFVRALHLFGSSLFCSQDRLFFFVMGVRSVLFILKAPKCIFIL